MNADELASSLKAAQEEFNALFELCMSTSGRLTALEVINDALIAAVGHSFPPLVEKIRMYLDGLSDVRRQGMDRASLAAFDAKIGDCKAVLEVLGGSGQEL